MGYREDKGESLHKDKYKERQKTFNTCLGISLQLKKCKINKILHEKES